MKLSCRMHSRAGRGRLSRLRAVSLVFVLALALLHVGLHNAAPDDHGHFSEAGVADCQLATVSAAALPETAVPAPILFTACRNETAEHQVSARYTGASWSPRAPPG